MSPHLQRVAPVRRRLNTTPGWYLAPLGLWVCLLVGCAHSPTVEPIQWESPGVERIPLRDGVMVVVAWDQVQGMPWSEVCLTPRYPTKRPWCLGLEHPQPDAAKP